MTQCPVCGNPTNENQRFCTVCGTVLDSQPEHPIQPEQPVQSVQPIAVEVPDQPQMEEQPIQQPVVEAQPVMEAQPTPVVPFIQNRVKIDEKELVKITGNCWTNLFKTLNWVFFILEVVGAIALCVLHIMNYIDFVPGNETILIAYTAGVVVAALILFGLNMLFLSIASDITKTRKHLDNIEYMMKIENQN